MLLCLISNYNEKNQNRCDCCSCCKLFWSKNGMLTEFLNHKRRRLERSVSTSALRCLNLVFEPNNSPQQHTFVAHCAGMKAKELDYVFLRLKCSFHWVDLHGNTTSAIFLKGYHGLVRLQAPLSVTMGESAQSLCSVIKPVSENRLSPKQTCTHAWWHKRTRP